MSTKKPNREEQLVFDCLQKQGFTDVVFEPDGNVPPDLLVNGKIAVEVRRLNQNISSEAGYEGLEQTEYKVHSIVKGIMDSFPMVPDSNGVFVGYHFQRPLPPLNELKKVIKEILTQHLKDPLLKKEYSIGNNFELELFPASNKLNKFYKYGLSSDGDSGGFVIGLIHENLKIILEEKEGKVKNFKPRYPEWWIGLVDNVGYVMDDYDLKQFYELPKLTTSFDRILIVSPLDSNRWVYLYE